MKYRNLKYKQLGVNGNEYGCYAGQWVFFEENGCQWPDVFNSEDDVKKTIDWFLEH